MDIPDCRICPIRSSAAARMTKGGNRLVPALSAFAVERQRSSTTRTVPCVVSWSVIFAVL